MSSDYTNAFSINGNIVLLPRCNGSVLRRSIDDCERTDLTSPYPLFLCENLEEIPHDIDALKRESDVSLTLRTNIFDHEKLSEVKSTFDIVSPFKTHYVADLTTPWREFVSRRCRRYAAKAESFFEISVVDEASRYASLLMSLNQNILNRVSATSNPDLTLSVFQKLLKLPESVLIVARDEFGVQGLAFYLTSGDYVLAHTLGATDEGRAKSVVYGLYGHALDYFQDNMHMIDFGGNVGATDNTNSSLSAFKNAWSNHTQQSYICGKILDPDLYMQLSQRSRNSITNYFPRYRANSKSS